MSAGPDQARRARSAAPPPGAPLTATPAHAAERERGGGADRSGRGPGPGGSALEAAVAARAREFEVLPLLRVLTRLGYRPEAIVFAAHPGAVSPATLVHAVEFREAPARHVRVVLNLGLGAAQGVLPSYLVRKAESGDVDARAFHAFLGFLEHAVLSRLVAACHPESSAALLPDWEGTKRRHLQLVDLRAPAGLHALFAAAFPELAVAVEKRALRRPVPTRALRLGRSALGEAAFGDRAQLAGGGCRVVLSADEERTAAGDPWPQEARARIERLVLPALAPSAADLEVELVLEGEAAPARLDGASRLGVGPGPARAASRRVHVFSCSRGMLPSDLVTAGRQTAAAPPAVHPR